MKRSGPLKRGQPLARGTTRLKARKVPKAFRHRRDPAYQVWVRQQYCLLWNYVVEHPQTGRRHHVCIGPIQSCHVKSRGAGGDDHGNIVPLCAGAHEEQHRIGIRSFEHRWGVDLQAAAAQLYQTYLAETFDQQ